MSYNDDIIDELKRIKYEENKVIAKELANVGYEFDDIAIAFEKLQQHLCELELNQQKFSTQNLINLIGSECYRICELIVQIKIQDNGYIWRSLDINERFTPELINKMRELRRDMLKLEKLIV